MKILTETQVLSCFLFFQTVSIVIYIQGTSAPCGVRIFLRMVSLPAFLTHLNVIFFLSFWKYFEQNQR